MIYAGIACGGVGLRMGKAVPKQFLEIKGEPIIIHTVRKFIGICDRIYIACHRDYISKTKELFDGRKDVRVIAGGSTRMESLKNVLSEISAHADPTDIVVTHDGVRPFISREIIEKNIECAEECGACGTFVSSVDTMCISENGRTVDSVPPRNTLFNVQTPQTFSVKVLADMFESADEDIEKFTDLCGLAAFCGYNVCMILGDRDNIKITSPSDLKIAEALMEALV